MQVTSGSSATSYKASPSRSDISYDLSQSTLFQNMLSDTSVSDHVRQEADGTYEFIWSPNDVPGNFKQCVAAWLISSADQAKEAAPSTNIRQSDLGLFKEMTGYNLVVTPDGGTLVCDDYGNNAPDDPKIDAARDLVDTIAYARSEGAIGNDAVELGDMPAILNRFGGRMNGDYDVEDAMLKDLMKTLGASSSMIAQLQRTSSRGAEGESYSQWSLPADIDLKPQAIALNPDGKTTTDQLLEIIS